MQKNTFLGCQDDQLAGALERSGWAEVKMLGLTENLGMVEDICWHEQAPLADAVAWICQRDFQLQNPTCCERSTGIFFGIGIDWPTGDV